MAKFIEAENISQAWLKGCQLILNLGFRTEKKVKLHNFSLIIKSIQVDPTIDRLFKSHMNMKIFQETLDVVSSEKVIGEHPSYWRRLIGKEIFKINQIERIISRLRMQPHSTKLTFCIYTPEDFDRKYVPCILAGELRVESGKLNLTALIRSEDFGNKAYADYLGLARILEYLSERANLRPGGLILHIVTGFINNKDVARIKNILALSGLKIF